MNEHYIKLNKELAQEHWKMIAKLNKPQKPTKTYAERKQRASDLMDEAKKAMETGDLDLVKKHHTAGRYNRGTYITEFEYFGIAAKNGHVSIVDFYIHDAATGKRIQEMMMSAAAGGQLKVIDYLIEQGADKQHICNALYQASWNNQPKTVEHLLFKGAIAGYRNDESLLIAASDGSTEVVKILLQYGADIHANDDRALKLAVSRKHDDLTKIILIDLKMPIKDETKQWLSKNNGQYALELLAKRTLLEKLHVNLSTPSTGTLTAPTKKMKI